MPAPYLSSLAKKHNVSKKTLEKYWDEAKEASGKEYSKSDGERYYGTATKIFKNKINKHLGMNEKLMSFGDFVREASILNSVPGIGYVQAEKVGDGKYKLFWRGTRNEIFPGMEFRSPNEGKHYYAVQKLKGNI